jgi:hypothetical protein
MVCRVSISRASGRAHTDLIDFPRNYREFIHVGMFSPFILVTALLGREPPRRTAMPLPMRAQRPSRQRNGNAQRGQGTERSGEGGGRDQDG